MREDVAVKVLEGFRKNLKAGCDIDKALGVAIRALKRPRVPDTPKQYTGQTQFKKPYNQGNHNQNKAVPTELPNESTGE